MYNHYFALVNLDKVYQGFWLVTNPKYLHNDNISFDQLKKLDEDIDFLDVDKDNIHLLPKDSKAVCQILEPIYQKGLHFYQQKLKAEQQALLIQQQQYQYQLYQQQQNQANNYQYPQYNHDAYETQQNVNQMAYQQPQQPQYQNTYQQSNYQQGSQQGYPQQGYPQQGYQGHQPAYQSGYQNNYQHQQPNYGNYNQGGYQNNYGHNQRGHYNQRNHDQHQSNRYAPKNTVPEKYEQAKTQQKIIQSQSTVVSSEKKTEPEKVIVKVEPPKPEKKKLTIEEIRNMIASVVDKKELKKAANPKLVQQIQEVKNWEKKVESFQVQKSEKDQRNKNKGTYQKKPHNQHQPREGREGGNQEFNRGAKYDPKRQQQTASAGFDIKIGKNQNLETRMIKDKFNKAAKRDFVQQKEEEQNSLSKIQNATREMLFCLNKVAPQNLKQIFKQIEGYALKDKQICNTLVDLIIQKAWEQPKYAASYAKLSSYYCKIDSIKFEFGEGDKKKKSNEFKQLLIEKVQHSFDKKQKTIPKDESDPEKYARDSKNQIMGNVKFIAELIKIKLIHKKITKYCVAKLLESFLEGRYAYQVEKKTENNFYEFSFEAIIQFLENLAEKFDAIDQKQKQEETKYNLKEIQEQVLGICELKSKPKQIAGLDNLKAEQYFDIFELVREKGLKQSKDGGRLSALLQNLMERKKNNWKRHHVQAEKPTKLKDVNKEDEPVISPEERAKLQSKQANQKMKKVFKKLIEGDNKTLQELDYVYKKHTFSDFMGAYLTQVSDDKKDNIPKRLQLFDTILSKYLEKNNLLDAWKKNFQGLSYLGSEFPFCAAALAKILIKYVESKKGSYNDFFIKYDEDDQEDEYFFMQNLFQKLYHYTKEEDIKKVVTPKEKLSHLL